MGIATPPVQPRTDILLSMARTKTEDYMQQIVTRVKTHEFRRKHYTSSVVRVWFYEVAPISAVTYICDVGPAVVRPPRPSEETQAELTEPDSRPELWLPGNGEGNDEYNTYHPAWDGYDYAYPVYSCWRIKDPVSLADLKGYGIGGAPRGMVYVPEAMQREVVWDEQELLWSSRGVEKKYS